MKNFFKCVLVTLCYWLIIFIGPAIVLLWNNFSYYVSGLGYGSESLMYKILSFFSQPIACFLASAIAGNVAGDDHRLSVFINCLLGSVFCSALAIFYIWYGEFTLQMWQMIVSTIACIVTTVIAAKDIADKNIANKIQRIFGWILITIVIWAIARFIPALIGALDPDSYMLQIFAFIIMLPIGWLTCNAISKGRYRGCIRANLYVFSFLELIGLLQTIIYVAQNTRFYTGRYTTDAFGIAYSDYPVLFGSSIIFDFVYIAVCIYLAKKTDSNVDVEKDEPEPPHEEIIEKNHEEKQRLRDEIAKMKTVLKEHDATYEENKKILAEAFTDEELAEMVANDEFPAERVDEYLSQRNSLAMFINYAPYTRQQTVKMIGDLTKQLAELECEE